MGQQQTLLIILAIVIVLIAVVVGVNFFGVSRAETNRKAIISELKDLATLAQMYYRKPVKSAGGGGSFAGWLVPSKIDKTVNGLYTAIVSAQTVLLVGSGVEKGKDGLTNVKITMLVGPDRIVSTTVEN
jgi:hypothetical protein